MDCYGLKCSLRSQRSGASPVPPKALPRQPAIFARRQRLETEIGERLFDGGREVLLTDAAGCSSSTRAGSRTSATSWRTDGGAADNSAAACHRANESTTLTCCRTSRATGRPIRA